MITYREIGGEMCTAIWIATINKYLLNTKDPIVFNDLFSDQKYYRIDVEDEGTAQNDYGYSGWIQNPKDGSIVIVYYTRKGAQDCYIKSVRLNPANL